MIYMWNAISFRIYMLNAISFRKIFSHHIKGDCVSFIGGFPNLFIRFFSMIRKE